MGSIGEEDEGAMLDCSMPVWRSLYSEDNGSGGSGGVIAKDDRSEVGAVEATKPQANSSGLRRGGKPWTPPQVKMQRAAEVGNGGMSEPDQILVNPVEKIGAREAREDRQEEEAAMEAVEKERLHEGASDQSGAQQAALHAESEEKVVEKREAEAGAEDERHQPALEQARHEGIPQLAEAEEKTLEAGACKIAELGARGLGEEEELVEKATTNSHYYRLASSSLTSPARSAISSSTHLPIRSSPQFRGQSVLDTDPLLCDLTPVKIIRLSTSENFDFEPGEKEWSLRAAEGTVKVNDWLGEVEGWNGEWRPTYRGSKDARDGCLPPAERLEKGPETGMGSTGGEEEGAMLDGSMPVRWSIFSEDNGAGGSEDVILKDNRPEVGAAEVTKAQTDSPGLRRDGKLLTPSQLKMQRQGEAEEGSGERSELDRMFANLVEKIGVNQEREEEEEEEAEFLELHRQRRLAEDEPMRLADLALPEREKAREAKDRKQRSTLGSSSSAPSTTAEYKVCIIFGFGNISADYFDRCL